MPIARESAAHGIFIGSRSFMLLNRSCEAAAGMYMERGYKCLALFSALGLASAMLSEDRT
ncbi:hypothetical protein CBM2592_P240005 [Cupriavidus taiwanensis]|uniref:Uncharacterized protein n=2 Tax=Cupriavidus TaxID=106589 RepID=A0A375GL58_9BURK|nr:hypothetical protein CBM2592_P240005 [Cupriavidus taiwanensis]SPD62560.1 protein of unknown function [Cupriavidus neocaledonicus]SOY76837.1 hypothetical protein CBM2589_P360003 [Cupriavidus taiwanensis]SOZ00639.1 hypothetical protein CBM2591_P390003 [Cupriavidus taiwanensis]SOZ02453.1 hypothetical protein CBM2600_P390003 [Cupriavidus taiwanensis]